MPTSAVTRCSCVAGTVSDVAAGLIHPKTDEPPAVTFIVVGQRMVHPDEGTPAAHDRLAQACAEPSPYGAALAALARRWLPTAVLDRDERLPWKSADPSGNAAWHTVYSPGLLTRAEALTEVSDRHGRWR